MKANSVELIFLIKTSEKFKFIITAFSGLYVLIKLYKLFSIFGVIFTSKGVSLSVLKK